MSSASLIRFSSKDCLSTFHLSYLSVSLSLSLSLSLSNTHSNVPVRTHTHTSLVLAELSLTLVQRMSSFQRMCCNKLLIVLFSFFYSTFASQKVFVSIQIKARLTVGVIQPLSKKMAWHVRAWKMKKYEENEILWADELNIPKKVSKRTWCVQKGWGGPRNTVV